ncbi:MAG: hypothetical protein FJY97_12480 [candidate division Zixibacteria bacterium]|nr:hypothetical protein [candidate division Zixibacteria bacterium]
MTSPAWFSVWMRTTTFLLMGGWMVGLGCVRTHTAPLEDKEGYYRVIETATQGRLARIRLNSGDEQTGMQVRVTVDSVSWMTPDPVTRVLSRRQSVPASGVREITVVRHGKSTLIGAAIGAAIGFGFGGLPTLNHSSGASMSVTRRILLFGSAFGSVGLIGGAIAGYKKPVRDIFLFDEYLADSPSLLLAKQLKGTQVGVDEVVNRLRKMIAGIDPKQVREEITATNIVYRIGDTPFCMMSMEGRRVNLYLSVRQLDVADPQGLLRRWSSNESWFSITPGGDYEYALSLILQAYRRVLAGG